MSKICVVGAGYVGLVTSACFADLGHRVSCVDIDKWKVIAISKGVLPFHEPGLDPLVRRNLAARRLCVSTSFQEAMKGADFIFMCVGTPITAEDKVDLSYLHLAYLKACTALGDSSPIFVNKSTVPPGTTDMIRGIMGRLMNGHGAPVIACNPEFLREGHAVYDFMHPSRIVVGAGDQEAAEAVAALYQGLDCPHLLTDATTAELVKYASNAFLATKISYINEVAALCEDLGVDVDQVAQGVGLDPRIGQEFLKAGIGYGGSCLPKDTAALARFASAYGGEARLLSAVKAVNGQQPQRLVQRVKTALGTLEGAKVAVLGLAFKPNTDDVRCSPAAEVIKALQAEGALVRSCDPVAWRKASTMGDGAVGLRDPYDASAECDAVVLATDWPQFKQLNLPRLRGVMRGNVLADGRNLVDPGRAAEAGFLYMGVGRLTRSPEERETPVQARVIAD